MKWGKIFLVIFGAIIVTALGIDAADTLQGSNGTLLSQVVSRNSGGVCPEGMAHIQNIPTLTCVDMYEVSAGKDCPVQDPEQMLATIKNVETKECVIESVSGQLPWRFVTRDQALSLCARSGKRLPTSEEWYALTLGMSLVESACNTSSKKLTEAGAYSECVSPIGAYDLVGNVWEWVSDDVIDGVYKMRTVPDSGYVAQIDAGGMATAVIDQPQELFGNDYFWSKTDGAYGIIRGGYYDSGSDAGLYTVHADTLPTTASVGIGFRCVK